MADLSVSFCGIKAPNPFWLASAPPTDKAYNVERAFRAGWGGVVWKTWARTDRRSSTCRVRATTPGTGRTGACSASPISS